jgi:hypothetical protein
MGDGGNLWKKGCHPDLINKINAEAVSYPGTQRKTLSNQKFINQIV